MRINVNGEQRRQTEDRIRAAMDRLLRDDLPPGGKCDVKSQEAGITRAALYTTYLHLKEEFESRRDQLREAGDPREGQIQRLKEQISSLQDWVRKQEAKISELTTFRTTAVSRLSAQHDEITRLCTALASRNNVRSFRTNRE